MFASLAVVTALATAVDGPAVDSDAFLRIIKAQTAPLKSLAFVYEGEMRWTGPRNLIKDPDVFGEQFQGTYLYRSDGAALYDVYLSKLDPSSGVQRHRMAIINKRIAKLDTNFDAKRGGRPDGIIEGPGSIENFDNQDSPHALFMGWTWASMGESLASRYRFEGWEDVGGRNCLRFAIVRYLGDPRTERSFRRYWIDVERNAQVLKMEYVGEERVGRRIEGIELTPFSLPDGSKYWMPTHCRVLTYAFDDRVLDEPVLERTFAVVSGSVQLNVDLPDALFSLKRDSALPLPGESEKLKKASNVSDLRRRYEAQPAPAPVRTDPVSVRKRIDEHLAEADRQSEELRASSPARQTWAWSDYLPYGFAVLCIVLVAAVAVKRWRG